MSNTINLEMTNLTHISPSTFMIAVECELAAYLAKWSGQTLKQPQTEPMAIGSIVDSFIKAEIALTLGREKDKHLVLSKLLESVDPAHSGLIAKGKALAEEYIKSGAVRRLIDDGLTDIELEFKQVEIFGVPVWCKPDAKKADGSAIDWKVNGFGSRYGGSPKQGYYRYIDGGMDQGKHDLVGQLNLEDIDLKWATQLLMYYWVLNLDLSEEDQLNGVRGHIEQICVKLDRNCFVSYDLPIGSLFVQEVKLKLISMWARLQKGDILVPTPSKEICHPYGKPRICTAVCPFYQRWNDPANQSLFERTCGA